MNYCRTVLLFILILASCTQNGHHITENRTSGLLPIDSLDMTNNFYDNTETFALPVKDLTIEGEIANPGKVDFSALQKHSVIVKETLLDTQGSDRFVGAYRYDGYSLFDILNDRIIKKANVAEFSPVIDLFVEIENENGEKVVFSWGEIYYPVNLHKIIIATNVSRIVPSKTKELWQLPAESKIVAANDLITERNISSPVKIRVKSFRKSFIVVKGLTPMYSKAISLNSSTDNVGEISGLPANVRNKTINTIFYGRGKGIHSTQPFTGTDLKDILLPYFPVNKTDLRSGILLIVGIDGYRCAVSYSELFNRNDQQEFLFITMRNDEEGGLYRIIATSDFFSDRAIKAVSEIYLVN
jgi:hypothetical protein